MIIESRTLGAGDIDFLRLKKTSKPADASVGMLLRSLKKTSKHADASSDGGESFYDR